MGTTYFSADFALNFYSTQIQKHLNELLNALNKADTLTVLQILGTLDDSIQVYTTAAAAPSKSDDDSDDNDE